MAPAVTRNVVFRSIETKWRGPLPCSWSEFSVGIMIGLPFAIAFNALVGALVGFMSIATLVLWRRIDHDRTDYVVTARLRFVTVRTYNGNEPDDEYLPLERQ